MKAIFYRKIRDLSTLKELTQRDITDFDEMAEGYRVGVVVSLRDAEFREFAEGFLEDRDWFLDEKECPENGLCFRVVNRDTGESVVVDTQGYGYARYVALDRVCFMCYKVEEDVFFSPEVGEYICRGCMARLMRG